MYAVIRTGGKQYVVNEGDTLKVEKLDGEKGANVEFKEVLAVGEGDEIKVGTPTVSGALVTGQITAQGKGKKVIIFKKRKRKGYTKKQGHRQLFTSVKIQSIKA